MSEMAIRRSDVPKIVGTVGVKAPSMVFRLGVSYLRMKKRTQRATKQFVEDLQKNGMPKAEAKRLGDSYATDLSIRKMMSGRIPGLLENLKF